MSDPLLEVSPFKSDESNLIGRDPRKLTAQEFENHLPDARVGMAAIRAKCLDCALSWDEVRKCTVTSCPLWHLRMGSKPKALREARGEKIKDASK